MGSENNDAFILNKESCDIKQDSSDDTYYGKACCSFVSKATNHAGGILGGISDGSQIVIRAHVKPTPSIYQPQHTVNQQGEEIEVQIKGRHDPIVVPRAVVVMECMTALTVVDALMLNATAKMENLKRIYES